MPRHGEYSIGPGGGEKLVRAYFGDDDFDPLAYHAVDAEDVEPARKRHQHQHANAAAKTKKAATPTADVKVES